MRSGIRRSSISQGLLHSNDGRPVERPTLGLPLHDMSQSRKGDRQAKLEKGTPSIPNYKSF